MQMLNKLFAIILLYSHNVFLCTELSNLNLYKASTQTISLDFIQSFENSERSFVKGQIFYERPNLFKISTSKPTKTDLIVNGTEAFRTDYQLNETIKYELRKIEFIPCFFSSEFRTADLVASAPVPAKDGKIIFFIPFFLGISQP